MSNIKLTNMLRSAFKTEGEKRNWVEMKNPKIKYNYTANGAGGVVQFLTFEMPDGSTVYHEVTIEMCKAWHKECRETRRYLWEKNAMIGALRMQGAPPE